MLKKANGKSFTRTFRKITTLQKRLKELATSSPSLQRKEAFIDSNDYVDIITDLVDELKMQGQDDSETIKGDIHYYLGMLEEKIHLLESMAYDSQLSLQEDQAI